MLTDKFTARVLGAVVLVMTVVIDVSCFLFVRPELRARPTYPLLVIVPSLPLVAFGAWLLWRASKLDSDDDD